MLTAGCLALLAATLLLKNWRQPRDLIDDNVMTHALLLMLFCFALAVILQENDNGLLTGVIRLLGLSAILILWLLLGLMPQLWQQRQQIIAGIVLLSTLQALLAIAQTCFPAQLQTLMEFRYHAGQIRPYGIFQQFNLLASFLATGLAATVWLCLQSDIRHRLLLLPAVLINSGTASDAVAYRCVWFCAGAAGDAAGVRSSPARGNHQDRHGDGAGRAVRPAAAQ